MEKKDIRSDLLKSFGMESRAFTWLEEIKRNVSSDEKMYNLTVGSPDGMPEDEIVETMVQQVREPGNHTYASLSGNIDFRKAVAEFYQKRYNVTLDPLTEVIAIPGAKRALLDLAVDFCSAGRGILLPNICYPTYRIGAQLAHAVQHEYRRDPDNNFAPVYADMDRDDCDLLYINYPHNPTCACADLSVFENTIAMAKKNGYQYVERTTYSKFDTREEIEVYFTSTFTNNKAYRISYKSEAATAITGNSQKQIYLRNIKFYDFWKKINQKYGTPDNKDDVIWGLGGNKPYLQAGTGRLILEDPMLRELDYTRMSREDQKFMNTDLYSF